MYCKEKENNRGGSLRDSRRSPLPNSVDQLWVALQEEWSRIPIEYINKLYDSLPRRVSDIIAANGGATRY
ncbi:hypothetical protein F5890DRAFT_1421030 [Lentinula detonsa]|uniref:Uncharacterized protein n=1 Tax=Lentinula detonsa TaxID=2804962 RepID=A0AA38PQ10_9AGAR|nr:hypothetical protein F5890DRAFT_1421030 [Lentinula detonsa]